MICAEPILKDDSSRLAASRSNPMPLWFRVTRTEALHSSRSGTLVQAARSSATAWRLGAHSNTEKKSVRPPPFQRNHPDWFTLRHEIKTIRVQDDEHSNLDHDGHCPN